MNIKIIDMAVNADHVHIFFLYPPKYSLSYIAKKIKGRSSRILRQEFPHLREWCDEHLRAPGCYHGSVRQGWEVWRNIFPHRTVRKLYRQKRYQAPYPSSTGLWEIEVTFIPSDEGVTSYFHYSLFPR